MTHYVYILCDSRKRYYIGHTAELDRRIQQHRSKRGGRYTARLNGIELQYFEEFPNEKSAIRRESQLKRWTRAKKEALISGDMDLLKRL